MTLSEIEFVSRARNAATRCVLRAYNAAEWDCGGRGSAPDPAGGAYSAPQSPYAGFKGSGGEGGREERGGEGKERRGAGTEGKGREGEVDSDAQLEQGRRLAKAGPAYRTL